MANRIKTVEPPAEPETLEDALDHELYAPDAPATPDWFQDCEDYSLPKECMPGWRTVH